MAGNFVSFFLLNKSHENPASTGNVYVCKTKATCQITPLVKSSIHVGSVARSRVAKHVYENHIEQKNIYFKQNTLKLIYPVRYS